MLTYDELLTHLRSKHAIAIEENQRHIIRKLGYYHGYKGFRFVRSENEKISFSNVNQIAALNDFDMKLKTHFYPKLMEIENAFKSYLLEAILEICKTDDLNEIYKTALTSYKNFPAGSSAYKNEFNKKMTLQMNVNQALIRDYAAGRKIERHFFDADRAIPVWAVFESLSMGNFATFFSCSNNEIKFFASHLLGLPASFDSDGNLIAKITYCLKDLRNAVAHNGIIFDTRFATRKPDKKVKELLQSEIGIEEIQFEFISAYFVLVVYILQKLKCTTRDCKSYINDYKRICTELERSKLGEGVYEKIVGVNNEKILERLSEYFGIEKGV